MAENYTFFDQIRDSYQTMTFYDAFDAAVDQVHTWDEMEAMLTAMDYALKESNLGQQMEQKHVLDPNGYPSNLVDSVRSDQKNHYQHRFSFDPPAGSRSQPYSVEIRMGTDENELSEKIENARRYLKDTTDNMRAIGLKADVVDDMFGYGWANTVKNKETERTLAGCYRLSKEVEHMMDSFEGIENECKKMESEKGFHINSREYKDMMNAAKSVRDLSKGFDPNDAHKVDEMRKAMTTLSNAATKYAEKEAYKVKSTERGISRKNTAFALMSLTDPDKIDADRIQDFRKDGTIKKENAPHADAKNPIRNKSSLQKLMREEGILTEKNTVKTSRHQQKPAPAAQHTQQHTK